MNCTKQQEAIRSAELNGILKVEARAGTGKTSSLVLLSQARQLLGEKGLYLAFNKAAEIEAKSRFPASVTCKTVNGLAYSYAGRALSHKLGNLRATDAMRALDLAGDWQLAKMIVDTIQSWCISDLLEFPDTAISSKSLVGIAPIRLAYAGQCAEKLWHMMCDPGSTVPCSHDAYMKLFQLRKIDLPYDYIMLDEAQDTNPVTWSFIKRQACPIIIVGDQYQSIYQFRGAYNAMAKAKATQTLALTESFRFGPAVATVANAFLTGFFDEKSILIGSGFNTVVGQIAQDVKSVSCICRTNAEVFNRAVGCLNNGNSFAFVGGVSSYGFETILDAWYLSDSQPQLIRSEFIRDFASFSALEEYAEMADDHEARRLVDVVKTYGQSLKSLIPAIGAKASASLDGVDTVLSTAHKCKGLTLENVIIADDFPELISENGCLLPAEELDRQEVNLIYVAVTRATHRLQLNQTTKAFLLAQSIDPNGLNQVHTHTLPPIKPIHRKGGFMDDIRATRSAKL